MLIKIKPLSINKAFQGRRFKSPEYKVYEQEMLLALKKYKGVKPKGNFKIEIVWYFKNNKASDIDNPVKPFMDCLTKSGIIQDDKYCVDMHLIKAKGDNIFDFSLEEIC